MTTKKHTATLLILMFVGLAGLVHAQTPTGLKAQIPFAFVANGQTMPAGECTIAISGEGREMLSISSGAQHVFVVPVAGESPKTVRQTVLVFHRYGNRYFLASIKRAGGTSYEFTVSKTENELRAGNVAEEVLTLLASAK